MTAADVWIVNAGYKTGAAQVASLLGDYQLAAVSATELSSLSDCEARPAVLIAVIDSWRTDGKRLLDVLALHASELPIVVIDQSFNTPFARQLAAQGIQDYLGPRDLDSERLTVCVSFAVVRHGHQSVRKLRPLLAARPDLDVHALRQIVNALRPSEREVFDLLITCYSNAELGVRLGKSRQTIINQIGGLKQHFDVNSREELILISILCLPEA